MTMTKEIRDYFNAIELIHDIKHELSIMHPDDLQFVLGIITPMGDEEENIVWKLLQPQKNLDIMKK